MIGEAIAAVHRLIAARLERNLGLLAAIRADRGEHKFLATVTASEGFVLIHNCILLKIFTFTGWHSQ